VVEKATTSVCPICKLSHRHRDYHINGPFYKNETVNKPLRPGESNYKLKPARVSDSDSRWNRGLVSWLIRPPGPDTDGNIYTVIPYATCKNKSCRLYNVKTRVDERTFYRRFGRLRLFLIKLEAFFQCGRYEFVSPIRNDKI
jgi:hypothetical protein